MAVPMSPTSFVQMMRAEGVNVVEVPGWRTNNRNRKGAWGPVNGVMIHHTVTGPKINAVNMCYDGLADLPGPLCHGVIRRDGSVHLVGNGRANHAGGGDPNVLAAVRDERYNTRPPEPHQHQGSAGAVDGNAHFYGFECENLGNGSDPWPAAQVDAIIRVSAALCRFHGWTAKSTIGHSEWSDWKNDPRGPGDVVSMPRLRGKIQERLDHAPSWSPSTPTQPKPTTPKPTSPTGGTPTVTTPNYLSLSVADDFVLLPNQEKVIYWDVEHADTGNTHGAGGKTVLSNGLYAAYLSLAVSGLDTAGDVMEVYPIEEDASGNRIGTGFSMHIPALGEPGLGYMSTTVPVGGRVGQRLAFALRNRSLQSVTLNEVRLVMFSWPNV